MTFSLLTCFPSCADAAVALGRIGSFLTAEELAEPYLIDKDSKHAVDVEGDFEWETVPKAGAGGGKFQNGKDGSGDRKAKQQAKKADKKKRESVLPTSATTDSEKKVDTPERPFELKGLNLKIPKGSFVAIVGRVGSGKVSR